MNDSPTSLRRTPIIITEPITSPQDLFRQVARAAWQTAHPTPTNLDGLADLLKEAEVDTILCAHWRMPRAEADRVQTVFDDLGVKLKL